MIMERLFVSLSLPHRPPVIRTENPVIYVREDVVLRFQLFQPWFVVAVFAYGVDEPGEVVEVGFGPPDGVVDHGAGLHDEGPVRGLGEQQFPGRLV